MQGRGVGALAALVAGGEGGAVGAGVVGGDIGARVPAVHVRLVLHHLLRLL